MFLARRNLLQEPVRLLLSVMGVALAIMLILILNGFLIGNERQVTAYLEHSPGSVVVSQKGIDGFLRGSRSVLPPGIASAVSETDGVSAVVPILSQFTVLDLHGKQVVVYLIGYEPELGGGPWSLARGREPRVDSEVVVDTVMARRHGIILGDTFELMDQRFTVVGLSDGATSWMMSLLFLRKSAVETLVRAPDASGYLLVTPSDDSSSEAVRDRLGSLPGTEVMLKSDMIDNDQRFYTRVFNPPLQLMAAIALLVGSLVVGLVIYTATTERQREYGVLKALGAKNRLLYRVVLTQALIASGFGALIGVALSLVAMEFIMWVRPQFLLALETSAVVVALSGSLAMALLAAVFPARVVAGLAPADAFRR
jgi:putative ABC transport system permease protein